MAPCLIPLRQPNRSNGHGTAPCTILRFRPGPVRSALDDLVKPGSPSPTISTPSLARTPDRHRETEDRAPNLTPSDSLALLAAGLQDHATGLGPLVLY
ncbi:hypothetical protein AVEN_93535-1 [Araneus ventricosus]|uniref:Uncharacterized protein n=1 Tax=Araneus ventricosus TaxID=182803 RepID=A0A4Y2AS10_ARAVE|nr:hypothetical protein AVEN_93535-1 [Araneus ventricosus]